MYPGTCTEQAGEMAGETFERGDRSFSFFCMVVSVFPTYLGGDGGPRPREILLCCDWRSGYDLGAGLTGCDGGIDE
jgi:hypothetical protein